MDGELASLPQQTSMGGSVRVITNRRILLNPVSIQQAIAIVSEWLELENTHLVSLEKKNWPLFSSILIEGQANGDLVMDAHLAAMAAIMRSKTSQHRP